MNDDVSKKKNADAYVASYKEATVHFNSMYSDLRKTFRNPHRKGPKYDGWFDALSDFLESLQP